jgi:DNA topoisomerase IB
MPQRPPPRMAVVVTRLLADAFSVCGGTNDAFDNLHNHSLESKALMNNELQVLLWKMDADV